MQHEFRYPEDQEIMSRQQTDEEAYFYWVVGNIDNLVKQYGVSKVVGALNQTTFSELNEFFTTEKDLRTSKGACALCS